jgi:putative copper export protein
VALVAVIAVAVTGLLETFLFLPSVGDLFGSAYGRLVLAKVAGLGGLVAFGAWHRFKVLPRLAGDATVQGTLRTSVRWETGLMAAVVLLAAVLAYVPPPAVAALPGAEEHRHEPGEEHE